MRYANTDRFDLVLYPIDRVVSRTVNWIFDRFGVFCSDLVASVDHPELVHSSTHTIQSIANTTTANSS